MTPTTRTPYPARGFSPLSGGRKRSGLSRHAQTVERTWRSVAVVRHARDLDLHVSLVAEHVENDGRAHGTTEALDDVRHLSAGDGITVDRDDAVADFETGAARGAV